MVEGELQGASRRKRRLGGLWLSLTTAHDAIFAEGNKLALKRLVIWLSIAGFATHLLLIFLNRTLQQPPSLIMEVGHNYLNAISTPFSFILFYEVLTLIAALPASTTRSIANQFEIVSLIFIRDVFRDIAKATDLVREHQVDREALPIFLDMSAGLMMFFLVAVFQFIALRRVRPAGTPEHSLGLERFIAQKKIVAIGLSALLLGLAAYNIVLFLMQTYAVAIHGHSALMPDTAFYNDLFTVMIFTDVLILILSLVVSGQYEMVFRNAAFVVSIILIRFSLTEKPPYGAPLALLAMVFGILTLLVFNLHSRLQNEMGAG